MQQVSLDELSYIAFPITTFDSIGRNWSATGFYYQVDKMLWLVTNWHCLTGFNPDTNKRVEEGGKSPEKVKIPIILQTDRGVQWKWYAVDLYEDKAPKWLIHPVYGTRVDVVAVEIGEQVAENRAKPINTIIWDVVKPVVADDVYVLGFPYGHNGGGKFPLWKRATVASEPDIDYDSLPQFVIDSSTREGQSGAPVILRRVGVHGLIDGKVTSTTVGEAQTFTGVYSGRFWASNEEETQLGRVWKKEVIEEIINGGVKDARYYPDIEEEING